MADDDSTRATASRGLAAKIIASYLRHNKLGVGDLPTLIASVHQSFASLGAPTALPKPHVPAVSVRRSVQPDYVVCLECGYRGQMLRRHLVGKHRFTPREYRARWDLPRSHPITAPSYSERRSTMAKALGPGQKAASSTEQQIAETPTASEAPPPSKQRRRLAHASIRLVLIADFCTQFIFVLPSPCAAVRQAPVIMLS